MLAWYRKLYDRTKAGTILATIHLAIVGLLVALIAVVPSNDWMWWPVVPFWLDFPVSLLIGMLTSGAAFVLERLPHEALERLMMGWRAPFYSVDLFWLPAAGYLVLGTVWHFYWPVALARLLRRDGRDAAPRQRAPL
jgi:hypothetical protein